MRVIGIDPGTVSIDLCGLDNGRLFLDRTLPTADALANPSTLIELLDSAGPLDLIAGPSGYGLPLKAARDLTDADLRLAYLAAEGESGGIGGLRALMRALSKTSMPVLLTPGVIHLPSVPDHRKVNRVDMGTADKVCAVALALHEEAIRGKCRVSDLSFILLELGGAFTAAVAVDHGKIVDGAGGTSGAIGLRASGALDGEVAFLAGTVSKAMLFQGGVADITSADAWEAYFESVVKAVAMLSVSTPDVAQVILSGRSSAGRVHEELARRLPHPVRRLIGFSKFAKHAAQGAAVIADGLAAEKGTVSAEVVESLALREASGTVLDHLHVISPAIARARIGL